MTMETPLLISSVTPLTGVKLCTQMIKSEDMDTLTSCDEPSRKRQRLDHLSYEEKMLRRKLKNRVAAQSARDRKKAQMDTQEKQIHDLTCQLKKLKDENANLRVQNEMLIDENKNIKLRLDEIEVKQQQIDEKNQSKSDCRQPVEHAAEAGFDGGPSLDDALRWLSDVDPDEILDFFQKLGQEIPEEDLLSFDPPSREKPSQQCESKIEMVGTTTEQLESIKELIRFDHIYHKIPDEIHKPMTFDFTSEIDDFRNPIKEETINIEQFLCDVIDNQSSLVDKTPPVEDDEVVIIASVKNNHSTIKTVTNRKRTSNSTQNLKSSYKQDIADKPRETLSETLSDSGYESGGSLLSPYSDHSEDISLNDSIDGIRWGSSLTELFPSLM